MQEGLIFLALFATITVCSAEVQWSEWRNLTVCDGRPCDCAANERDTCKSGHQIQVRICKRVANTQETCKYDKDGTGSIRKWKCWNGQDTCPGWSDWMYTGKCICNKDTKNGNRTGAARSCNNPSPIHDEVQCLNQEGVQSLQEVDDYMEENCTCSRETTTQHISPTTPLPVTDQTTDVMSGLPCCNVTDYYADYNNTDVSNVDLDIGGLDGSDLGNPDSSSSSESAGNDYGMYDYKEIPLCRQCTDNSTDQNQPDDFL